MPMDLAMLPHSKFTILRRTLSEITRQQALRAIFKEHCYADCQLSVMSTNIHCKAQTPLGRFVVNALFTQLCNKYTRNNTWSLSLRVLAMSTVGARNSSLLSTALLISCNGMPWRNLVHSCTCKNGSHELTHAPFVGDLSPL